MRVVLAKTVAVFYADKEWSLNNTLSLRIFINQTNLFLLISAAPSIHKMDKYKDAITILAGKSTVVEVEFSGSPQPETTWSYNGGRLPDVNRTTTDTSYNFTQLNINRAKLSDAGKYSLTLSNKHGKVTLDVKVKVLGEFH